MGGTGGDKIEERAGLKRGYNTVDDIFTLYYVFRKHLMKNTNLHVDFVDFRKAFHSVNRCVLRDVLRKAGV